jgi:hypothetical protein
MFFFWLLVGGLVLVSIALGAVGGAFISLRRDLAQRENAPRKSTLERVAKLSGTNTNSATPKTEIATLLREELAAFQAVYRADLAQMRAEIRSTDAQTASFTPKNGLDRLDHAIALARAGHKGEFIARTCDLDPADAEALVRFHGPERALALSLQH